MGNSKKQKSKQEKKPHNICIYNVSTVVFRPIAKAESNDAAVDSVFSFERKLIANYGKKHTNIQNCLIRMMRGELKTCQNMPENE